MQDTSKAVKRLYTYLINYQKSVNTLFSSGVINFKVKNREVDVTYSHTVGGHCTITHYIDLRDISTVESCKLEIQDTVITLFQENEWNGSPISIETLVILSGVTSIGSVQSIVEAIEKKILINGKHFF